MPELKNTWKDLSRTDQASENIKRGLRAELTVLKHYEKTHHRCLAKRLKTPYAEIDLLFWTPDGNLLIVEVKSSNSAAFKVQRIPWRQKLRLQRALVFLAARFDCLVAIHWAFVTRDGLIHIVDDICG